MGNTWSIMEPKNIKFPQNIKDIFNYKSPLFSVGDANGRIYIFSNSREHVSTISGHIGKFIP